MTPATGDLASRTDDHGRKPAHDPRQEMTTMLDPEVRRVLDGTSIAHLASVLPDGAPHSVPLWVGTHGDHVVIMTGPGSRKARNLRRDPRVALSLTPPDDPFRPVIIRGRVVEWLEGDAAWTITDRLADKYIGRPYPRDEERVVAVIEPAPARTT
ncbi:PPOX class F420-dependent oxidoreductase [Sphaerisporangium rhizosphaerae]|uniref:PPOX class F420-dependent oxidoreductase n=1 Tax=Sphaerisporangium rhizosphaerae TaxID=2269375 RepID=A0ABW2P6W7_9ACTN